MDLTIIISVAGRPGLFKVVGRSKNGLIAESLIDQKRIPVRSTDKVSALSDISIFTYSDDLPLKEVLQKMHIQYDGKPTADKLSDGDWMASELRKVLPEYDENRVYTSDLKKLFKWYNLLAELNLIDQESEKDEETDEIEAEEPKSEEVKGEQVEVEKVKKKEAKKPASKKETTKK